MKRTDHNSTPDLRELSQGMTIGRPSLSNWSKRRLKKLTLKNVSALNTIPKKYHKKAAKAVIDSVLIGSGLLDLLPFFQSIENIDYKMAHSISLHMTRRLYIDLNFIKMEAKGFKKYEWLHSGGQNLECVEHTQMNGKIYSLDNSPIINSKTGETGRPGDLFGCRCRPRFIISFDE